MAAQAASSSEKNGIWSLINKCVFCRSLSDGRHKLLQCLHIVCKTCIDVKMTKTGLLCLCLELSDPELSDYSIIAPNVRNGKTCNIDDCEATVKKFCQVCQVFYCGPCANIHLSCNKNHKKTHIVDYPIITKLYLCSFCNTRDVEVFCNECTVATCSICHLRHHSPHVHTILEQLAFNLRRKFSSKIVNLEKHNSYLNFFLEFIQNAINDLNNKYQNLDITTDVKGLQSRLLTEMNKHDCRPYTVVNHNIEIAKNVANANTRRYTDLLQKNIFYIGFIQSILKNGDANTIITMSSKVWDKLFDVEHTIEFSPKEFNDKDLNEPLNLDDKALENCIIKIQTCAKLIESLQQTSNVDVSNGSEPMDVEMEENDDVNNTKGSMEVKEGVEIESISSSDSDGTGTERSRNLDCSCCNQWVLDEKLIKCIECGRRYHYYCHIPGLPSHYIDNDQITATWKCTMCKDISEIAKVVNERSFLNNIVIGSLELVIIHRLLLELFCQNDDSQHFRDCPNKNDYPQYYKKVLEPISLNQIKNRLDGKGPSYIFVNDIFKDMTTVFSNAMMYYSPTDPDYISASCLQRYLIEMVNKWVPNMYHCLEY